MDEPEIKKLAKEFLEKEKKCKVRSKSDKIRPKGFELKLPQKFKRGLREERKRKKQILDIIGISEEGEIYIVECKAGVISRPLDGIGQLTRYYILVEKLGFKFFKKKIEEKWIKNNQKLREWISRSDRSKLRYYLAVPKDREEPWNEILKKSCEYLGFKESDKYKKILLFEACEKTRDGQKKTVEANGA